MRIRSVAGFFRLGRRRSAGIGPKEAEVRNQSLFNSSTAAAILGLVLTALPAAAASLRGTVVDPHGLVVADAQLRLFDTDSGDIRETAVDPAGEFSFLNLPDGPYLLEGSASKRALGGYLEVSVAGDSVVTLPLSVSAARTEVVVTSSASPLPGREVAKAVDAVDAGELALRDEFSLAEAIRTVPGVHVKQLRGPGTFTTVRTRGLRAQDTALLVDGLRFRDAAAPQGDATSFFGDMTMAGVESVEYFRGSGSSLYGSHSVGGTMNVNSSQGGGQPHGELRAEGGGLGMARGVASFGGGLSKDRFGYSGSFSHLNVTEGYRGGIPHRNSGGRGFAKYLFSPDLQVSARVWAGDTFLGLAESPAFPAEVVANFPDSGVVPARALPVAQLERFERGVPYEAGNATFVPSQIDPDNRRAASFLAAALTLSHQLSPGSSYRVAFQHLDTGRSHQDGPSGPGAFEPHVSNDSRYDGLIQLLQARTDHRVAGGSLLTLGYEMERELYVNRNTDEGVAPVASSVEIDQASHAVFLQAQVRKLDGRLHIGLSSRFQGFDLGVPAFSGATSPYETVATSSPGTAFTGDAAAAYFFRASQTKLRVHAGNSFRAPSLFERFGGTFAAWSGGFTYWGDPRLDPEQSLGLDAGIDQWLFGSRVRLSGTAFYTDLSTTLIFDFANFPANDPFGRYGGYRASTGGIARGVEASAHLALGPSTRVSSSYTHTNAESRMPTIGTDYYQVPGQSTNVASFVASRWIGDNLNVTFDLFVAGDYVLSPYGALGRRMRFDGPVKADAVIRYELPVGEGRRLEIYGKGENVFDDDYYEDGFGSPGLWVIGGVRYAF